MKTKITLKSTFSILSLAFVFLFSTSIYAQSDLNCGSKRTRKVNGTVGEHSVSGLTSADTSKAINAYYKWIASSNSSFDCINESKCGTATCVKTTVGIGGTEGNHPTPTYDDISGKWKFPEAKDAVFKCECVTRAVAIFEIFEGGVGIPIDPYIGNESKEQGQNNFVQDNITIAPNPAQDQINVSFSNELYRGEMMWRIYSADGQLAEESYSTIRSNDDQIEIYLDDYAPGLYYMTVHSGDNLISKSKFIITQE